MNDECLVCSCGWRSDHSAAKPIVWASYSWLPEPHSVGHYACPVCSSELVKQKVSFLEKEID